MRKIVCVILSLALILGTFVFSVEAGTIAELDNTGETAVLFTFEDDGLKTKFSSSESIWQKDATHALSYYNGSWSSGSINANPVTTKGNDANSIVNNSEKAWNYYKRSVNTWRTAGGNALHVYTENGPEPVILQNGVTYKLSFDYMVSSGHLSGEFTYNNVVKQFSDDASSWASVGYGYKTTSESGLHSFASPQKQLDIFIDYRKKDDNGGTFIGDHSTVRKIGNWYHVEYEFTPKGLVDLDFSQDGTLACPENAPFLVFYISGYSGASFYIDNIKLQGQIAGTLNAMGGTPGDTSYLGFVGETENIKLPTRYGHDFAGWYKDGALTNKWDGVYTADMNNGFLFASWDNTKIGFESYAPYSADTDGGSHMSVSADIAATGKNSMKYAYSKNSLEGLWNNRTSTDNMFSLKTVENNKMYKLTFKYYHQSGSMIKFYPVTVGASAKDSATYKAYTDYAITTTSADTGVWKTATIYFTTSLNSTGNNIGVHVEAVENNDATMYFDDFVVVESLGGANLTINAGEGTIDGQQSITLKADYGDSLNFDGLYKEGYYVEGMYLDADFTQPCTEKAFVEELADKTIYVKWSKTQNFEFCDELNSSGMELTKGFAKSGATSLGINIALDDNAGDINYAAIAKSLGSVTYVLEFYYYAPINTVSEIKPVMIGEDAVNVLDGFTLNGTAGEWKKAALCFTAVENSTELGLAVIPQTATDVQIYIDDVTVTALESDEICLIFDSMSVDKQRVASIGTIGSGIVKPAIPEAVGKSFDGWYKDAELTNPYSGTSYDFNLTVYAKMNALAESNLEGDVDGNGRIDAADLARMKRYLAGHDVEVNNNADVDANRKINAIDLVKLNKLIIE